MHKLFLGTILSLIFIFATTSKYCSAMELAAPEPEKLVDASPRPWFSIFDFFWVLLCVAQQQAESDLVPPPTPASPSSPVFQAETTMRVNRWADMDAGCATKEQVAREAAEKGQDYDTVVRYIQNIATWIKPIPLGMELYKRLKAATLATFLLSNLSIYCLTGLQDPSYFPRVNATGMYESPNIFADAHVTATSGFPYCEGYSFRMGLSKPDVLCYKLFLVLNCPDVRLEDKQCCLAIQRQLLDSQRQKFEAEDHLTHAAEERLESSQITALTKQAQELQEQILIHRTTLNERIEAIRRSCPALDTFTRQCAFIDDSPRNLDGAEKAGIYPISCQCHAVAYVTAVKKGIMPRDKTYERLLDFKAPGHFDYFGSWTLEQLHDYDQIDDDLYGRKDRDSRGIIVRNSDGSPRRISPPKVAPEIYT